MIFWQITFDHVPNFLPGECKAVKHGKVCKCSSDYRVLGNRCKDC